MKVSLYCLKDDLFVFADNKEYRYLRVNHAVKSISNNFLNDPEQVFNLFKGVYYWFFSENIKSLALAHISFEYLDALKSNYHTLLAVECALEKILEEKEYTNDDALISLLRHIQSEEKGHYKLIEKDVGFNVDALKFDDDVLSSSLINHIKSISGPNSALDILAVGLVLEFNSLHVVYEQIDNVLKDVGGESEFYSIHSFSDIELQHFKRNIAFVSTLKPWQLDRVFYQVEVVIGLFFSFKAL